jgi:hypothetical protein
MENALSWGARPRTFYNCSIQVAHADNDHGQLAMPAPN